MPAQFTLASLFESTTPERKARRNDPGTSRSAARTAWPRAGSQRHRLVEALRRTTTGLTAEQAATATGLPYVSASTRISELKAGGWVEVVGQRKTHHGSHADVLVLTPAAHEALAGEEAVAA